MKYQPNYPGRFQGIGHARSWCEEYISWYNTEHQHSGLAGFTPEQVYTGDFESIAKVKQQTLDTQYLLHPERFVKGQPKVGIPEKIVYRRKRRNSLGSRSKLPNIKKSKTKLNKTIIV